MGPDVSLTGKRKDGRGDWEHFQSGIDAKDRFRRTVDGGKRLMVSRVRERMLRQILEERRQDTREMFCRVFQMRKGKWELTDGASDQVSDWWQKYWRSCEVGYVDVGGERYEMPVHAGNMQQVAECEDSLSALLLLTQVGD